jgi:hypothetical protein
MKFESPAFLTTAILVIIGTIMLMSESDPFFGALFFVPFALGPLLVSLAIAAKSPYRSCQLILTISSLLYAAWFVLVFLDVFYWHLDPQSAIAFLFVGIYSLPIMIPVWLTTLMLRRKNKTSPTNCSTIPKKAQK